jgi:hypothetical protein
MVASRHQPRRSRAAASWPGHRRAAIGGLPVRGDRALPEPSHVGPHRPGDDPDVARPHAPGNDGPAGPERCRQATEGVVTITRFEPDRAFAAVVEFGPFRLDQQAICSPAATGGTHLTLVIDTHATGPLRLLLPMMRLRFAKTMRTSLGSIKQHVEEQRLR